MKLFLLAISFIFFGSSPTEESKNQLSLRLKSEAQPRGQYYIKLTHFEEKEKKELLKVVEANSTTQQVTFETLPKGMYTLAVFHDVNGNGKLDKNYLGIPTEPYGFSNNARGMFGPPSEKDQLFTIERETIHELFLE